MHDQNKKIQLFNARISNFSNRCSESKDCDVEFISKAIILSSMQNQCNEKNIPEKKWNFNKDNKNEAIRNE